MMLNLDLPKLIAVIACRANRKAKIKDLEEFEKWLHIISDAIVVKVYAENDIPKK